jgi:hypothetical protein
MFFVHFLFSFFPFYSKIKKDNKKYIFMYLLLLESCGTVPNPEKSRLSRPAGQTGLSRKLFGTGQTGSGQFKKIRDGTNGIRDNSKKTMSRNFLVCIPKRIVNVKFHIFNKYFNIEVNSTKEKRSK